MAEGNPMLILEQGEKVQTPPAIWIQGQPDIVHDYRDPDYAGPEHEPQRFVNNYRKAGGEIDLLYVDNAKKAGRRFIRTGGGVLPPAYPSVDLSPPLSLRAKRSNPATRWGLPSLAPRDDSLIRLPALSPAAVPGRATFRARP